MGRKAHSKITILGLIKREVPIVSVVNHDAVVGAVCNRHSARAFFHIYASGVIHDLRLEAEIVERFIHTILAKGFQELPRGICLKHLYTVIVGIRHIQTILSIDGKALLDGKLPISRALRAIGCKEAPI